MTSLGLLVYVLTTHSIQSNSAFNSSIYVIRNEMMFDDHKQWSRPIKLSRNICYLLGKLLTLSKMWYWVRILMGNLNIMLTRKKRSWISCHRLLKYLPFTPTFVINAICSIILIWGRPRVLYCDAIYSSWSSSFVNKNG